MPAGTRGSNLNPSRKSNPPIGGNQKLGNIPRSKQLERKPPRKRRHPKKMPPRKPAAIPKLSWEATTSPKMKGFDLKPRPKGAFVLFVPSKMHPNCRRARTDAES